MDLSHFYFDIISNDNNGPYRVYLWKKLHNLKLKHPARVWVIALNTMRPAAGAKRMLAPARLQGYFTHCACIPVRAVSARKTARILQALRVHDTPFHSILDMHSYSLAPTPANMKLFVRGDWRDSYITGLKHPAYHHRLLENLPEPYVSELSIPNSHMSSDILRYIVANIGVSEST